MDYIATVDFSPSCHDLFNGSLARKHVMAAYLVTHMKVSDPHKYQEYTRLAPAALTAAGGRMIARGEAESIEGVWPDGRVVIIEFPTLAAARGFHESALYQAAAKARQGATEFFNVILVPGAEPVPAPASSAGK